MGKIIRNGITYGGGSDEIIQCTQAQYDAWEQAGTIDPTKLYCITDASSGSSLIDDNTTSQSKTWSSDKIDDELDLKANASTTYTKSEVDSALSNKQNSLSNQSMSVSFNVEISGGGIGAVRYGNVAIVSMVLKCKNAVNANTQIATLANATIVSDCYVTCYGSQGAHARLKATGAGVILTESELNNTNYYSATFTVIIS